MADPNKDAGLMLKINSVVWVQKAGETGGTLESYSSSIPGGTQRIFAEKNLPSDKLVRDEVTVRVTISKQVKDIPVKLYLLDVDDPSSNAGPVDDETKPADNRGAVTLLAQTVKTNEQG